MEKYELYHFHKEGNHDKLWKENNTINVPPTFESTTFKRFNNFTTAVPMEDGEMVNFFQIVQSFYVNGIPSKEILREILEDAYKISFNALEFKREQALENYRVANVNHLPSRLHSIYLTDEESIETWKYKFGTDKLTLYRVEAEGTIFKTNEQLIPDEELSYGQALDAAYRYWHPNFKKVPNNTNEYLCQGKVKILEKIKNW